MLTEQTTKALANSSFILGCCALLVSAPTLLFSFFSETNLGFYLRSQVPLPLDAYYLIISLLPALPGLVFGFISLLRGMPRGNKIAVRGVWLNTLLVVAVVGWLIYAFNNFSF